MHGSGAHLPVPTGATVGVTGTKGKTSTVDFIAQIFDMSGGSTAINTTEVARIGTELFAPCMDTQDMACLLALQQIRGADRAVFELTSYSLAGDAHHAVSPSCAVLTNIGSDHFGLHGNKRNYVAAKARLFRDLAVTALGRQPWAVLNADEATEPTFAGALAPEVSIASYSTTARPERPGSIAIWAEDIRHDGAGTSFRLRGLPGGGRACHIPLVGAFNVSNVLAALACAVAQGVAPTTAVEAAAELRAPLGRFEVLPHGPLAPTVVVDFAHTAESLRGALVAARHLASHGRVVVVFGCGSDNYSAKRRQMGAVAGELADRILLTSDSSRHEAPSAIAASILRGVPAPVRRTAEIVLDRRRAVTTAIHDAAPDDVVLVAGLGAQQSIVSGDHVYRHCDRETALEALASRPRAVPAT